MEKGRNNRFDRNNRSDRNNRRDDRNNRNNREESAPIEETWVPKTQLGKDVLAGKYSTMTEVLLAGKNVVEDKITEYLIPNMGSDFINVGQAKGKFGGGKRKISKPTQKKTRESAKMSFTMIAVSGNKDGVVGLGVGKAGETVPAREKATRNAKKQLIIIRRGCGDWGCFCGGSHSIPFAVEGKCGSVKVRLLPAPKGTGLIVEPELKKMLELAGIKDVWSRTYGQTKNKLNLMRAGHAALKQLQNVKLNSKVMQNRGIKHGDKNE